VAVWVGFAFGAIDGKAVLVGLTVHVGVAEGGRVLRVGVHVGVADGMASGVEDRSRSWMGTLQPNRLRTTKTSASAPNFSAMNLLRASHWVMIV
jgi:hypothetical protein